MTRLLPLAAVAVISALLLAACGGSSSSSGAGSTGASSGASASGGAYGEPAQSAPAPAPAAASTIRAKKTDLGTILVDGTGRTLYLWKADTSDRSSCSGVCAQAWPPLIAGGKKPAAGAGVDASLLGTTRRADGSTEVTYAGHPLYHYVGDTAAGQTSGQGSTGFGALWWVVKPDGRALTS